MRHRGRIIRRGEAGFSLLEAMIALAISSVVVMALYYLYSHQLKLSQSEKNVTEVQESSRFMIEAMGRDLVMTGYQPVNQPGISEASPQRITIEYLDEHAIDLSGMGYDNHIRVTYRVDTSDPHRPLIRDVQRYNASASSWSTAQSSVLGEYVRNLQFTYFNDQDQAITPGMVVDGLKAVRRIQVLLTTRSYQRDPFLKDYKTVTVTRTFRARNLGIAGSPQDISKPLPPQNIEVIDPGICGTLMVQWTANTETDLDGYYLYIGQESGSYVKKVRLGAEAVSYTITGLSSTKSVDAVAHPVIYYIAMTAFDKSANASDLSAEVYGNPQPVSISDFDEATPANSDTTINPIKPARPESFDARDGAFEGSVALTWTPSTSTDIVAYRIFRDQSATPGPGFTASGKLPGEGNCIAVVPATATSYTDGGLLGCVTYYYKICAVNCDDTLVDLYDQALDYAETYGDGIGEIVADDIPADNLSDSTPTDHTPIDADPLPVPQLSSDAGWQRVFVTLTNPNFADDPDFSHTLVYFNKGVGFPQYDPVTCAVTPGTGTLLPDSGGRFTQPGTGLANSFVFDSEDDESPDSPNLQPPDATFYFLAVSFDRCGNCTAVTDQAKTLSELCGDDPLGLPQCSPEFKMTADAELGCSGGNVYLNWTGDCLKEGVIGLNHDFAGFEVFRSLGQHYDEGTAVNLSNNVPQWSQGFTDALADEGTFYSYAIKWLDCAWANNNGGNISNPDPLVNGGLLEGVSLGQILGDGNLILSGDLALSPPVYYHNKVSFKIRNTSAAALVLNNITLSWDNPLAYLQAIYLGDDDSTTRQLIWGDAPPTPITTTLTADVDDLAATLNVAATQSFLAPGLVRIDGEELVYHHKSILLNEFTDVHRGVNGTAAAAHAAGATVELIGFANFLSADIAGADTVIPVEATDDFRVTNPFYLGGEKVSCTGETATTLTGCTRGVEGTPVSDHTTGEPITQLFAAGGGQLLASPTSIQVNKEVDGLDGLVPIELYFANAVGVVNVDSDMREDVLQVGLTYSNPTATTAACAKSGTFNIPAGPIISETVQNPPGMGAASWRVPGYSGLNTVNQMVVTGGSGVTVYTNVADNASRGIASVRLYYYIDVAGTLTAAPAYTGANYTPIDMALVSGELWRTPDINPIPAADNSSVWFFIVARDNDGNFDREPEMEAGAFQYFQQAADICWNWPSPPVLSGTADTTGAVLTWTKPATNTNGTLVDDLAGYRVERSANGWSWTPIATINDPDTLTYTDSEAPDISGVSYYYQVVVFDTCADWAREGWSNRWRECVGEPTGRFEYWASDMDNDGAFEAGDTLWPHLTVCGSTEPYLWIQDCSLTGGDADGIRMKLDPWSGGGDYYIDWEMYNDSSIRTWLQADYPGNGITPGPSTNLDLWVDNSGLDIVSLRGFWVPGLDSPPLAIDSTCLAPPLAGVQPLDLQVGVPSGVPSIQVVPQDLWPGCEETTDADSTIFTIGNNGAGNVDFTITIDRPWLSVSPSTGSVAAGLTRDVTVTYATAALTEGTYTATITITAPGAYNSPLTMDVDLNVWRNPCRNPQPPGAPSGLGLMAGQSGNTTSAVLVWTPPAGEPAVTHYNLYRCKGAGCDPRTDPARVVRTGISGTASTYTDTTDRKLQAADFVWQLEAVNEECWDPALWKYSYSNVFQEGL